jgi:hypothetical protein
MLDLVLADSPMGRADIGRRDTGRDRAEAGRASDRPHPSTRSGHAGSRPPAEVAEDPSPRPARRRTPAGGPKKGKVRPKAKAKPKGKARKGRKKR